MPRQARYAQPAPRFTPVPAGACEVCRIPLNRSRRGSMLDYICNSLINPRPDDQPGRTPRRGTYEERIEVACRLHDQLRGGTPGWGRLDINVLTIRYDTLELADIG